MCFCVCVCVRVCEGDVVSASNQCVRTQYTVGIRVAHVRSRGVLWPAMREVDDGYGVNLLGVQGTLTQHTYAKVTG